MAYTKFNENWENSPSENTPITAEALNHIEQGLVDVETTPGPEGPAGPKGDTGAKGAKGDTGPAGADGADGFPTQEQWDALEARVAALEP